MDETGALHRAPDLAAMRRDLFSSSVSDDQTRATIKQAWEKHRLLLEPHGAVGWRGCLDYLGSLDDPTVAGTGGSRVLPPEGGAPAAVLETAHPAKFPEEIEKVLGFTPDVPLSLAALDQRPEDYDRMAVDYEALREYLVVMHRGI